MTALKTTLPSLTLIKPNPILHAPITLSWFNSEYGTETLLLMGNAEHEIKVATIDSEIQILEEFVELENKNKQLTWMIEFEKGIIGVAWIELTKNHSVLPPSIHLMIGDKDYRGRGIGEATMTSLIHYITNSMDTNVIYSRHLSSNVAVKNLMRKIGFDTDGESYVDDNSLEWQNVKLTLAL